MNVVRGNQFYGKRRQNEGILAGPISHRPNTNMMMAPRSANFRVRNNQVIVSETWRNGASRTFNKTPVRPITASSSSSNLRSVSAKTSTSAQRSTVRTSGTASSSRSHTTPSELRTPRSSTNNEVETSCIIAIAEGRGQARGEVGIAAIDTRRPHLILCQLSDSQTYSDALAKINVFNPVEVLLPNTFCESAQTNKLFSCVKDQYPHITITTVQRRHFNDTRGLQLIQTLCAPEFSSVEVLVTHRFYALAAAAALLKYVEFIQNMIFAPKSLRVDYQGSQNTMLIDVDTAQHLELVRGARGSACNTPYSLLGTLSHCHTTGGYRLLRASILQPSCLAADIEQRLDCVQELVNSPALFHALQAVLPKLADVEQLLALSMAAPTTGQASVRHAETQLNYTLLLKSCLENIAPFSEALSEAQAPYFLAVQEKLKHKAFDGILEHIKVVLHEDARATKGFSQAHLQRCFAVRTGINGLLDVARKTYCELVDDITEMVSRYKEQFGLPLRVGFSSTRGFHVQLPLTGPNGRLRSADLPAIFIQVYKSRSTITMTTQELVHADQRCKDSLHEIQTMSNVVISELLAETRQHAGCLYQLCEAVAQVDLLMALASVSVLPGYVRPSLGKVMCVQASRHPILAFLHHTEPVANNIFASADNNFHILTGPNMGGKSIYIRQVALLQILAQIGCFVPAESATFRVADRIFSRIGFDDSIECNASTFVLEMREMQFVLQNMTDNSLIIIDELCRGTSSEEGTAIAWALCEKLLSSQAFTFFTTHFLFLTRLQDVYPNVSNHHMEAVETAAGSSEDDPTSAATRSGSTSPASVTDGTVSKKDTWIRYTHRLLPGVTRLERYGLRLAKLSLMPDSITTQADTLLQQLTQARKPMPQVSAKDALEHAYFKMCGEVLTASEECIADSETLRERCKEIQARFISQFPDWQQHEIIFATPQSSRTNKTENISTNQSSARNITLQNQSTSVKNRNHSIKEANYEALGSSFIQHFPNIVQDNHENTMAASNVRNEAEKQPGSNSKNYNNDQTYKIQQVVTLHENQHDILFLSPRGVYTESATLYSLKRKILSDSPEESVEPSNDITKIPRTEVVSPQLEDNTVRAGSKPSTPKKAYSNNSNSNSPNPKSPCIVESSAAAVTSSFVTPVNLAGVPAYHEISVVDVTPTPCEEADVPETVGSPALPAENSQNTISPILPQTAVMSPSISSPKLQNIFRPSIVENSIMESSVSIIDETVIEGEQLKSPVYSWIRPKQKGSEKSQTVNKESQQVREEQSVMFENLEMMESYEPLTSHQFLNFARQK